MTAVAVVAVGCGNSSSSGAVSGACEDLGLASQHLFAGDTYAQVANLVVDARNRFNAAGEPDAAGYLYDWGDPLGQSTRATRSSFWRQAFQYGRSGGNPGLERIDELCGNWEASVAVAAAEISAPNYPVATIRPGPSTTASSPATVPPPTVAATTTLPPIPVNPVDPSGRVVVKGKGGTGSRDDPYTDVDGAYGFQVGAWSMTLHRVTFPTSDLAAEYSDLPPDHFVYCLRISATRPGVALTDGPAIASLLRTLKDTSSGKTYTAIPAESFHGTPAENTVGSGASWTNPIERTRFYGDISSFPDNDGYPRGNRSIVGTVCYVIDDSNQTPSDFYVSVDGQYIKAHD